MSEPQTLHRRTFLALSGAALAATTMPYAQPPLSAVAAVAPTKLPMPSWSIGQDDRWNWKPIKAATEHEARIKWMGLTDGTNGECEEGGAFKPDCGCDECSTYHSLCVDRRPEWDGHKVRSGDEHWFHSGMGTSCDRCDEEAYRDTGAQLVSGKFVCDGCMTLADWDIVDPEIAAELRADSEDAALPPPIQAGTSLGDRGEG